jgi:hypothetical protein
MSKIKDGGPAFPTARVTINGVNAQDGIECFGPGLSLRDYFAAGAMQSYLNGPDRDDFSADAWAGAAYEMADAMLKVRKPT